ncbi:MAG: domain containing protein [Segetibacter sp.]|nr:domain containing protein [Segetibacter sp.]
MQRNCRSEALLFFIMRIKILFLLGSLFFSIFLHAQVCTIPGQNPETAFPVCGSTIFNQSNVAICGNRSMPTNCANSGLFNDKNPYWYKFTCFTAGTLGFIITPNNIRDDYDWQLFDITGRAPSDVFSDRSLIVSYNWSGEGGRTGASSAGQSLEVCEGRGRPLFSSMPVLRQGHHYIMLVSHFTNSQSGYSLEFTGGTASITDTTPPKLESARAFCDGSRIGIVLNKKMKCNSLASDGSDFTISTTTTTIEAASGVACTGFDMDALTLTLKSPLAPGTYTITTKKGKDNNTLVDNCDAAIPAGDNVSFTVTPVHPEPFDSISPVGCAPAELEIIFDKPILCASVAADGSDFSLSGSSSTRITRATTVCSDKLSTVIRLTLSGPISAAGSHLVTLKRGTDGNTLVNECSLETPAGSTVRFTTKDTVSADFDFDIYYGCKADTVAFSHNGKNGVNDWKWQFDNTAMSTGQNPVYVYPTFGPQQVKLAVSNGSCSDSAFSNFDLDNELKANFTFPDVVCPRDLAVFKDTSIGKIVSWNWDFGNGSTSLLKNPEEQIYPVGVQDKNFRVRLIVGNDRNCFDTAYNRVKVLYNCFIDVPTGFTPNGDGLNDYLSPLNAWKAKNLIFKVYNRFGQLMFQTTDFRRKWDGTFNNLRQQTGTYVWTLQYIHGDTGKPYFSKGTTVLIR